MNAWRLCVREFGDRGNVHSREDASRFEGRRNEAGLRLEYAALNASLALLEQLAHMNIARLISHFVAAEIVILGNAESAIPEETLRRRRTM